MAANKEIDSQSLFDLLNLGTEGRLCKVDALRCSAEAALLCYSHKRYKMTELGPFVHDATTYLLDGQVLVGD